MVRRSNAFTIVEKGWTVRVQKPLEPGSQRALLLLHGWTGNEKAMSIFGRQAADDYWLIFPRAPLKAQPNGFGWLPANSSKWACYQDVVAVVDQLDTQVQHWKQRLEISAQPIDCMGFSQGGAIALCYLMRHPEKIGRVACLSGFLPKGASEQIRPDTLSGKAVYIAHGTRDKAIPIQHAQEIALLLTSAGATVEFCQDEIGHKTGPECYKRLATFFI